MMLNSGNSSGRSSITRHWPSSRGVDAASHEILESQVRTVIITCKNCGNEARVEILTQAEEADPQIPRSPVKCPPVRKQECDRSCLEL